MALLRKNQTFVLIYERVLKSRASFFCASTIRAIVYGNHFVLSAAKNLVAERMKVWCNERTNREEERMREAGLLILIAVPVLFFEIRGLRKQSAEEQDVAVSVILAAAWSIVFWHEDNGGILAYGMTGLVWIIAAATFVSWHRKKGKERD